MSTYEGWSNYPTWAVNLWLANDEGSYRATLELAAEHNVDPDDGVDVDLWPYADALREMCEEWYLPELDAGPASDLLTYAWQEIDWREIAEHWANDYAETVRYEQEHTP